MHIIRNSSKELSVTSTFVLTMKLSHYDEYVRCVQRTPHRVVYLLRRAHDTKDPAIRASYACAAAKHTHTATELGTLISFGVPELLIEILLEPEIYQFIEPPRPGEAGGYVNVDAIVSEPALYVQTRLILLLLSVEIRVVLHGPVDDLHRTNGQPCVEDI